MGAVAPWRCLPCLNRNQTLPYDLTYPVQGLDRSVTDKFGSWPILYEGVPCPVRNHSLAYQFLDASKAVCPCACHFCLCEGLGLMHHPAWASQSMS